MEKELRDLCVAFGRLLIALGGGEEAPSTVVPQPEEPVKRKIRYREKTMVCVQCGAEFIALSRNARYCQECKKTRNLQKLDRLSKRLTDEAPAHQPAPVPTDRIRCERMHATIPTALCGTRGECKGKPLCPNLPGGRG